MWLGNARHSLTRLLPHFPQAQWSWASHVYFPFFFWIQSHEAATVATGVDDIRILRAEGTSRAYQAHRRPEWRLYLFFPKPASKPCASSDKTSSQSSKGIVTLFQDDERRLLVGNHYTKEPLLQNTGPAQHKGDGALGIEDSHLRTDCQDPRPRRKPRSQAVLSHRRWEPRKCISK